MPIEGIVGSPQGTLVDCLGMRVERCGEKVVLRVDEIASMANPRGAIHGGIVLLAAEFAARTALAGATQPRTTSIQVA